MAGRHHRISPANTGDPLRAQLAANGYLKLSDLRLEAGDLAEVQALLDPLFDDYAMFPREFAHDLALTGDAQAPRIQEIARCSAFAPGLLETKAYAAVRDVARQLIGPGSSLIFDHAIYKPPGPSARTEWHQDSAYGNVTGLTIWLPLQDTEVEDGCMRYVSASHLGGPRPHHMITSTEGKAILMLADWQPDPDSVVSVPLRLGEACLHDRNMIHGAWPNLGAGVRRAWIGTFRQIKWPVRRAHRFKSSQADRSLARRLGPPGLGQSE